MRENLHPSQRADPGGDGSWRLRAACRERDHTIFFADDEEPISKAKAICGGCPVRDECLAFSMQGRHPGIWGGLTERERNQLRWRTRKARAASVARPTDAATAVSLLDESERVGETGVALRVVEEELHAEDVELAARAGEEELVVEPAPVTTEESWTPESMEDAIEPVAAAPEVAAHIEEPLAEALADEGESLADFEDEAVEAELARDEHDEAVPI